MSLNINLSNTSKTNILGGTQNKHLIELPLRLFFGVKSAPRRPESIIYNDDISSYIYRVSQKKVGSQKTSNCSNSLNFEAKIKCNTIKPNVPKWRKTCTGLKFDLLDFYGPQSNIHTF